MTPAPLPDAAPPPPDPPGPLAESSPNTSFTAPDAAPSQQATRPAAPRRASLNFMLGHPARWLALAFGAGLSPVAPGTVGTLWAWLVFVTVDRWWGGPPWGGLIVASTAVGWWACTRTAQHLGQGDPGAVVWDEVVAFWAVLWLVTPASGRAQFAAFALFRFFDAAKPGPVGWADRRFKRRPGHAIGWREGFGILFDDLVAALCTLLVIALWQRLVG